MYKEGLAAAQGALQHDNLATTLIYAFSDQLAPSRQKDDVSATVSGSSPSKAVNVNPNAAEKPRLGVDNAETIIERFFEVFGGREAFAEALEEFMQKKERTL